MEVTTTVVGIGVHRVMKIRVSNPNPNRFDSMTHHLKAVLFDVRCLSLSDSRGTDSFSQQIGGVVVQSPLLAVREYEIEHGLPHNYVNCLMFVSSLNSESSSHSSPQNCPWFTGSVAEIREGPTPSIPVLRAV